MSKLKLISTSTSKLIIKPPVSNNLGVLDFDGSINVEVEYGVIDVSMNRKLTFNLWLDQEDNYDSMLFNFKNDWSFDSFYCYLDGSTLATRSGLESNSYSVFIKDYSNQVINCEIIKSYAKIESVKFNNILLPKIGEIGRGTINANLIGGAYHTSSMLEKATIWDIKMYNNDNQELLNHIKGYPDADELSWKELITDSSSVFDIAAGGSAELRYMPGTSPPVFEMTNKLILKTPVFSNFTITMDQLNAEFVDFSFDNALSQDGSIWTFEGGTQPHGILDDSSVTGVFNTIQFKEIDGVNYSLSNNDTELTITSINTNQDASIIIGDSIYYSFHLEGELDPYVTTVSDASFNKFLQDTSIKNVIASGFPGLKGYAIGNLGDTEWIVETSIGSYGWYGTGTWSPYGEFSSEVEDPLLEGFDVDDLQPTALIASNIGTEFYMSGDHNGPLSWGLIEGVSTGYIYNKLKFDYLLRKVTTYSAAPTSQFTPIAQIYGPKTSDPNVSSIYQWRSYDSYQGGGWAPPVNFYLNDYDANTWTILSVDGSQGGQVDSNSLPGIDFTVYHIAGAKDISINASVGAL